MWLRDLVRRDLAGPKWANSALSGSIISVCRPVLRRIARRHRPLILAPTAMADSYEMRNFLRGRRLDAARSALGMRINFLRGRHSEAARSALGMRIKFARSRDVGALDGKVGLFRRVSTRIFKS